MDIRTRKINSLKIHIEKFVLCLIFNNCNEKTGRMSIYRYG